MGNGPGGLADYERIVDGSERLTGGFVWEWYDHGLRRGEGFGYGGDFGEVVHDGSFVIDGLVLPDRTPSPGLAELAAVFAPIRLDVRAGGVTVTNRRAFTDAADVELGWTLEEDGVQLSSAVLPLPALPPAAQVAVTLPEQALATVGATAERWVTVVARSRAATAWAPAGHVLGRGQLRTYDPPAASAPAVVDGAIHDGEGFNVGPAEFDDRGGLRRLHGWDVTHAGVDVWRAPTENDRFGGAGGKTARLDLWRAQGLDRLTWRVDEVAASASGLRVAGRLAAAGTDAGFRVSQTWSAPRGTVRLELEVVRERNEQDPLPRLDLVLGIAVPDPGSVPVEWFGLGPGENYPDSRAAGWVGRHRGSVTGLQTPYVVPQENGCRCEVRWAELALADATLRVDAADPVTFTVQPWSTAAIDRATHTEELRPERVLWLHLGAGIDGLGTASCGPGVLDGHAFRSPRATLDLTFARTPRIDRR